MPRSFRWALSQGLGWASVCCLSVCLAGCPTVCLFIHLSENTRFHVDKVTVSFPWDAPSDIWCVFVQTEGLAYLSLYGRKEVGGDNNGCWVDATIQSLYWAARCYVFQGGDHGNASNSDSQSTWHQHHRTSGTTTGQSIPHSSKHGLHSAGARHSWALVFPQSDLCVTANISSSLVSSLVLRVNRLFLGCLFNKLGAST